MLGFRGALLSVSAVLILSIVLAGLGDGAQPGVAKAPIAEQQP